MSNNVRVVIVDDHPIFRDGLKTLLKSLGMDVVGEAPTGQDAFALAIELRPDVVVMDLHMPDLNGIDATRMISESAPGVGVLVLTMLDDDVSVFAAMRAGARGYLVKGATQHDIARAITAVASGDVVFGATLARRIQQFFDTPTATPDATPFPQLSDREREVLDLVAQGLDNPTIAKRLFVSGKTVRNHVSNIFTKLRVPDRAAAIITAREAGLGRS